jgi:hypothetical protein
MMAANTEGTVLRAVTSGAEAKVARCRSEEQRAEQMLRVLRSEVSGAKSELEKSRVQELRIEEEARAELRARRAAEVRFADESKVQSEEHGDVLRRCQLQSELEIAARGEKVKALEAEAEKKPRTTVWDSAVWASWYAGWNARWEKSEGWRTGGSAQWVSLSPVGIASGECRGNFVLPASERPLKTATSLLEPARVDLEEDWAGRRTPPGIASRGTPLGGLVDLIFYNLVK